MKFLEFPATEAEDEFKLHLQRKGKPYSRVHRTIYEGLGTLLSDQDRKIFEVGFGIGFGLERLLEQKCVERYWGCEPSEECFGHVAEKQSDPKRVSLVNAGWLEAPLPSWKPEFLLSIEVLEHVRPEERMPFLVRAFGTGATCFFSTPDKGTIPQHGALFQIQWEELMRDAGFSSIVAWDHGWTVLYACQ